MDHDLISVIIPVHNGEAYIRDCLRSVAGSSHRNLEIIVVDDGSTDGTPQICRGFSSDPRIRLLKQNHRGVSAARNLGIRHTTGKYLMFLDADDLLDGAITARAVERMEKSQLVCWNTCCLYGEQAVREPEFEVGEYGRNDLYAAVIAPVSPRLRCGRYFRACWGKLFDTALIREHGIVFDEKLSIGEDAVFLLEYLRHTEKVEFLTDYGYFYRKRQDSSVRKYRSNLLEQSFLQMERIEEFILADGLAGDGLIRTAQAALYWDIFEKLVKNSRKGKTGNSAPEAWLRAVRHQLCGTSLESGLLPKRCRLLRHMPAGIQCALIRLIL